MRPGTQGELVLNGTSEVNCVLDGTKLTDDKQLAAQVEAAWDQAFNSIFADIYSRLKDNKITPFAAPYHAPTIEQIADAEASRELRTADIALLPELTGSVVETLSHVARLGVWGAFRKGVDREQAKAMLDEAEILWR